MSAIYTHSNAEGASDSDVIAADIGKVLAAKGSVTGPAFAGTVLSNINVSTATELVAASAGTKMVYVRHRGVDEAGDVTTAVLTILVDLEGACTLNPGEGQCFPGFGAANPTGALNGTSSSGQISVEVADID